jgi:predicted porin
MKSDMMSPLGLSGTLGGGGGVSENTRVDNSIKYKHQIGAVNFGALYKFGAPDGSGPGTGYALNLGYEEGPFGVQAVYESFRNQGVLSIASNQATVTVYDNEAYLLAARYKAGNATFKGGWERYKLKKPSDSPADGYSYFGSAAGGTSDLALTGYSGDTQTVDIYFAGGDYNVSPAFNVAAGIYDIHYNAYTGKSAGDIFWYSLIGDYKFSKRTDMYGGLVLIDYNGDKYSSAVYRSNSLGMVGIRHKF